MSASFLICHPSVWKVVTSLKIVKYVFSQNLCLQVQDQGNAPHLPMFTCLPKSWCASRVRRVYVYVGTSEKRTRWRRRHAEAMTAVDIPAKNTPLRLQFPLKVSCSGTTSVSGQTRWRLSSVIPVPFMPLFYFGWSTLPPSCAGDRLGVMAG